MIFAGSKISGLFLVNAWISMLDATSSENETKDEIIDLGNSKWDEMLVLYSKLNEAENKANEYEILASNARQQKKNQVSTQLYGLLYQVRRL